MTQQQLADAAGLPRWKVSAIECGRRRVQLPDAVALAAALGVPLAGMLGPEPVTLAAPAITIA